MECVVYAYDMFANMSPELQDVFLAYTPGGINSLSLGPHFISEGLHFFKVAEFMYRIYVLTEDSTHVPNYPQWLGIG